MGLSIAMKRRENSPKRKFFRKHTTKNHYDSPIKSLPNELLIDVLARTASSSFFDLFNAKLSCRYFLNATEDDYVFKHVMIEELMLIGWSRSRRNAAVSFFTRCKEAGNPQALYKQGMVEYFSDGNELGLDTLKKAADKGHVEAAYAYEIIKLCTESESTEKNLRFLNLLNKTFSNEARMLECRARTKAVFRSIWLKNRLFRRRIPCCGEKICDRRRPNWEYEEDLVEFNCCDGCRWDQEVKLFCNM